MAIKYYYPISVWNNTKDFVKFAFIFNTKEEAETHAILAEKTYKDQTFNNKCLVVHTKNINEVWKHLKK